MANPQAFQTGFVATHSTADSADMIIVWEAVPSGAVLRITATIGAGNVPTTPGSVDIPWQSTEPRTIDLPADKLRLNGIVQVYWGVEPDTPSYVVTFEGALIDPNIISVASNTLTGDPKYNQPIIVCAYLASEL